MEILKNTFVLYRRCFLQLVAIYLVGWLVRYGIVHLAVWVALRWGITPADFIMPVSTLVLLLTYLGMFWVARPQSTTVDGTPLSGWHEYLDTTLQVILPAFAIFCLWKLHLVDVLSYQVSRDTDAAVEMGDEAGTKYITPGSTMLLLIVGGLLVLRQIISFIAERLPRSTIIPRLYIESTWVYMFFLASGVAIFGSPQWISQRKIVAWYRQQKDEFLSHFEAFGDIVHWVGNHTGGLIRTVLLPLSWFVIAGLAYRHQSSATWTDASRVVLGPTTHERLLKASERPVVVLRSNWQRVPHAIRSRAADVRAGLLGAFDHARDALKMALQSGPLPLAFYIFLFTILVLLYPTGTYFDPSVTDGVMWRGVAWLIGPRRFDWWLTNEQAIRLTIGALVEPLRICLVSSTYWYCAKKLTASPE